MCLEDLRRRLVSNGAQSRTMDEVGWYNYYAAEKEAKKAMALIECLDVL